MQGLGPERGMAWRESWPMAAIAAIGLLGLTTMAAWIFHIRWLLLDPAGTNPMQFNTAVGFAILSLATLGMATARGRLAVATSAALVGALALLTGLQDVTRYSLDLDFRFFRPDATFAPVPGRMSLLAAAAFVSASGGLLAWALRTDGRTAMGAAAMPTLAFSVCSLLGYLLGARTILSIGFITSNQMALSTAIGLGVWAIAVLALVWGSEPLPTWLPWGAAAGFAALVMGLEIVEQSTTLVSETMWIVLAAGGAYIAYQAARQYLDLARSREAALAMSAQLEAQAAELARLDQLRNDFLGVVAHDVRSPLSAMQMALLMLGDRELAAEPGRLEQVMGAASRSLQKVESLVGDLLDRERIAAGFVRLDIRPCNAADLLDQAAEAFESRAADAGITLEVPEAPEIFVQADAMRAYQVLTNLLANAIKYTPPGGTVTLEVVQADGRARFMVADTGRGIPEAAQARIFDRFVKLDEQDRKSYGLGLAICHNLVERHGGRIWVESQPEQGSRFFFTLPLVASPQLTGSL